MLQLSFKQPVRSNGERRHPDEIKTHEALKLEGSCMMGDHPLNLGYASYLIERLHTGHLLKVESAP